jgi:hypothetical protein
MIKSRKIMKINTNLKLGSITRWYGCKRVQATTISAKVTLSPTKYVLVRRCVLRKFMTDFVSLLAASTSYYNKK